MDDRPIVSVHLEQLFPESATERTVIIVKAHAHLGEKNLPGQRIAVGVQPGARETDDGVTGTDLLAVDYSVAFDHADDGADQIVIARRVHAGHLRRLTANQRAACRRARLRETVNDLVEYVRRQFAHADVIEKKQWLRAEHGDVVDAMIDEVLPDRVVPVHHDGDLQLRADAVHAAHEYRPLVFLHVEREQPAKPADGTEHFPPHRLADFVLQPTLQLVAKIDVYARRRVSVPGNLPIIHAAQFVGTN